MGLCQHRKLQRWCSCDVYFCSPLEKNRKELSTTSVGKGSRGKGSYSNIAPVWNYLEVYWPGVGVLLAMNAIGTQLRDPINSGLIRWRMAVSINEWTPPRELAGMPKVSTRSSLSMEMSKLTLDGNAEPVPRDQIFLRREREQGNIIFPCSADHEQDWQLYPVDPYSCNMCDHTQDRSKSW